MQAPSEATIRPATEADLPAIETIVRAAYTPWIARIGREPAPLHDDYAARIAANQVQVAERAGQVVALLVLIPEPGALLLDNIAVAPTAQRTGLGHLLLLHAEQCARTAAHPRIRLYTNAAMTENLALYRRTGYRETHRTEENGLNRVYMTKPLA